MELKFISLNFYIKKTLKMYAMKLLLTIFLTLTTANNIMITNKSIYDFPLTDIDGNEMTLEAYKGNVLLIVNVASKCGYTPQYEGLQNIYEEFKDNGLVVIGFPANNFRGQEPGSNEDIKQFCRLEYGVEFQMAAKISVKGDDIAPLFAYLTSLENQDFDGDIKWNFEKFLIDREGNLIRRFRSSVKPKSELLRSAIKSLL